MLRSCFWLAQWSIYPPGCVPGCVSLSLTTEFLKYASEITEIQMTVSIQNSHWYMGDCTAWHKGPKNVPRLLTLWFFIVYCYFPPTGSSRRSDSSGFLTRFSGSNDENCFYSPSSAATTQMDALSALQSDREGQNMRQCVEQGPFSLSHLFPSY